MTSEGSQIAGRYTVERAVGRGGTGTVWLCRDDVLGRQVAVKQVGTLPGETTTDLDRALREARSAAGLSHPHVVSVFDAVEDDGRTWLVMEYVPSRTLAEILAQDGPLDPRRAARLGAQAAEGLAAAHARGIVHRDVKPGNILVTEDDRAKITDFGIALVTGDPRLTQTGLVVGTPSYFAPETARGEDPTAAADVWALGATLHEAVEGRPPYAERGNGNPLALLVAIAGEEAPPPTRAGALTGSIAAMMARDPAERWTMAEAARHLARVAEGGTDTAETAVLAGGREPEPVPEPEPEPAPEPVAAPAPAPAVPDASDENDSRSRRPWLVLVAAVVLLLAVGGIGIALATGDDDSPSADTGTTTGGEDRSRTPDQSASSSPPAEEESEAPPPEPEPSPEPPEETEQEPDGGAAGDPTAFAETYYGYLPGDTGSAYQLLSPDYRAQTSQADYEGFWSTVDAVEVSGVEVVDPTTVDVSLTYVRDGASEDETRRLYLAESGDGWVIVDDERV